MRLTKRDLVMSLHHAGRSVNEISKALECHPSFIERWIKEAGEKPYSQDALERDIEALRAKYATT